MAAIEFNQIFEGYWVNGSLPKKSGVYFVYECRHEPDSEMVDVLQLIYIGEGGNVNERIANHEKYEDWLKYVRNGNQLCFAFTAVEDAHRNRVEAAYIYQHKPPVNTEYKDNFPFDRTTVNTKSNGVIVIIKPLFTVERKD